MPDDRTTVMLADDHAVLRTGLRMMLERDGTMQVVAEAADGDSVLRYVRGHKPDVLVLDLSMPGRDTLEVIPDVLEASPATRVVVLTMQHETGFARSAFRAGASAYVLKEAAHEELMRAIDAARAGRTYVDPVIGARLASEPTGGPQRPDGLSEREEEVLVHICLGETNGEIAAALGISVRTVETHRSHIQQKTGRTSRSALVRYARDHGITLA